MIAKKIHKEAKKFKACKFLKGDESFAELVSLLFTPKGWEFCEANNFPSIDIFREAVLDDYSIFVDEGDISIEQTEKVVLVGDTKATMEFNGIGEYHVYLLHGASAKITANNFAVVILHYKNCNVEKIKKNNGLIV